MVLSAQVSIADTVVERPRAAHSFFRFLLFFALADRVLDADPDAEGGARRPELLRGRAASRIERIVWPDEWILSQYSESLILPVEEVVDFAEELPVLVRLVARIDVYYGIRRYRTVGVLVIFVTAGKLIGRGNQGCARREFAGERIVRTHIELVPGNAGNTVAGADPNIGAGGAGNGLGSRVVRAVDDER